MADRKRRKTPARYELGEALDSRLADLSEGYRGAPETRLVREAVEEFIERCLREEPAVRKRYEEARKKRVSEKDRNFSVVTNNNN